MSVPGIAKVVVFLHGVGTHSGLYDNAARELNKRGFIVVSFDMQGHGLSEGDRFYVRKWRDYVEDACGFIQATRQKFGANAAIFVVGISSGALIGLLTAEKLQRDLAGIIVLGAPLQASTDTVYDRCLGALESTFGEIMPHFPLYANELDGFVGDEQVQNILNNDPLLEGSISARTALELRDNIPSAFDTTKTLALPLLILHGEKDTIAAMKSSEAFLQAYTGHTDKTMLRVKDGKHDLLIDDLMREVSVDSIATWMESRSGLIAAGGGKATKWASSVTSSVTSAIKQGLSHRMTKQ